jgi:hypothetical protein
MPSRYVRTFKEAAVRATELPFRSTMLLLVCLSTSGAWAANWDYAPAPPARSGWPVRSGMTQGRTYSPGTTSQTAYQPTLANPANQSSTWTPDDETSSGPSAPQQTNSNEVSPEEMFPAFEDFGDMPGSYPPTLPVSNCLDGQCESDDGNHEMAPATGMTLSAGRWFNRGCWYAQEEFTYLQRSERGRHKIFLTQDFLIASGPTGNALLPNGNNLQIAASLGFSPGARITIGANLGTDAMNRLSAVEFTFQGLNNWTNQASITSVAPNGTTVATNGLIPNLAPQSGNNPVGTSVLAAPGFALTHINQYTENASLNSYELNFKLSKRMGRDRTVLTREGIWARVVTPQLLPSLFAGLRLIRYNDNFLWRSQGSDPSTVAGNYDVTAHNALFGVQFGSAITYQHENWRFTGRIAGGPFANYCDQHSIVNGFDVVDLSSPVFINRNYTASTTTLAMLVDFNFSTVYLFRPNMGLRFGYQILAASNLALASRQLNFVSFNPSQVNQNHGLYFQGISGGFEWAW